MAESRMDRHKRESFEDKLGKSSVFDDNKKLYILGFVFFCILMVLAGVLTLSLPKDDAKPSDIEQMIEVYFEDDVLQSGVSSEDVRKLTIKLDKYEGSGKSKYETKLLNINMLMDLQEEVNSLFAKDAVNGTKFTKQDLMESTTIEDVEKLTKKIGTIKKNANYEAYNKALNYAKKQLSVDDSERDSGIEETIAKLKSGSLILSSYDLNDLRAKIEGIASETLRNKYTTDLNEAIGSEDSTTNSNIDFSGKTYVDSVEAGLELGRSMYEQYVAQGYSNFEVLPSEEGADKPYYVQFIQ